MKEIKTINIDRHEGQAYILNIHDYDVIYGKTFKIDGSTNGRQYSLIRTGIIGAVPYKKRSNTTGQFISKEKITKCQKYILSTHLNSNVPSSDGQPQFFFLWIPMSKSEYHPSGEPVIERVFLSDINNDREIIYSGFAGLYLFNKKN